MDDTSGLTATYWYDVNGNLVQRDPGNSTSSSYSYDALDRVTNVTHSLTGDTRTFDYAYDEVGNRKWTKREGNVGDVFGYDYNDQVMAVKLNIANPDTTSVGPQTINYDANGNRTTFSAYGLTDTYTTNHLNQYSQRNSNTAAYNFNGDMTTGVDGSTYTYDAQNRLLTRGTTETFTYDGLNRQVTRTVAGVGTTYNVYDGWNLIQEYQSGGTATVSYFHGPGGLVKNSGIGGIKRYYYQDGSGSTSHLADSTGNLIERYRYDLDGTPIVNDDPTNHASAFGIRHLFTGQQWYSDIGLYDLRNRFYSPDIGRFLQPDPIGFGGDATNLYRYCGNNPLKWSDPTGMVAGPDETTIKPVEVKGPPVPPVIDPHATVDTSSTGGEWNFGTFASWGGPSTGSYGGRAIVLTRRHDPTQLGLSPGAPLSTQGQWTNLDGLPTGSAWTVELAIIKQYGAIIGGKWAQEGRWMINYTVPNGIFFDDDYQWWDTSRNEYVRNIYLNKDIAGMLEQALYQLQAEGHLGDLQTLDGVFNIRFIQGSDLWSAHSWGLALDINAATNPLGSRGSQPEVLVRVLTDSGFFWGGDFSGRKDPMHFGPGF